MAHLFQNLIDTIAAALKADGNVTGILHDGANGVYSGYDISINDFENIPRPFINVTAGRSVRVGRYPSRLVYKVSILVQFYEDLSAVTDLTTYTGNLEKIDTALEAVTLDSLAFSGDKALPSDDEDDGYITEIDTSEDGSQRITTITMQYQYHKYRS